jgi:hypothetical protein
MAGLRGRTPGRSRDLPAHFTAMLRGPGSRTSKSVHEAIMIHTHDAETEDIQALRHWATKEMQFNQAKYMGQLNPNRPLLGDVINDVSWSPDDLVLLCGERPMMASSLVCRNPAVLPAGVPGGRASQPG